MHIMKNNFYVQPQYKYDISKPGNQNSWNKKFLSKINSKLHFQGWVQEWPNSKIVFSRKSQKKDFCVFVA